MPKWIDEAIRSPSVANDDGEKEKPEEEARARALETEAQMSQETGWQLFKAPQIKFGDWDRHWQVFDPMKELEALDGQLADDIADACRVWGEGFFLAAKNGYPCPGINFECDPGFATDSDRDAIEPLRVTLRPFQCESSLRGSHRESGPPQKAVPKGDPTIETQSRPKECQLCWSAGTRGILAVSRAWKQI